MKYRANPVIVDAHVIVDFSDTNKKGDIELLLDNQDQVTATAAMTSRYMPKEGDYYVVQEDGYAYLNPKEVFERKYSPVVDVQPEPNDAPMEVHPEPKVQAVNTPRNLRANYPHLPQ